MNRKTIRTTDVEGSRVLDLIYNSLVEGKGAGLGMIHIVMEA
jgi:hypothetical protein